MSPERIMQIASSLPGHQLRIYVAGDHLTFFEGRIVDRDAQIVSLTQSRGDQTRVWIDNAAVIAIEDLGK